MAAPLFGVVLAGGVGSRFWPLSTPARPKQLLPLVSEHSMLEDTVGRLSPLVDRERILILTSAALVGAVRATLPWLGADQVLAEPRPAGTAAALAWAAHEVRRRGGDDAAMLSVHADAAIGDNARFREVLAEAVRAAREHAALATVGIVPVDANPGLGYIQPGATLDAAARRVERFLEKPDRARAEQLVAAGCLWNSGIFAWKASEFLAEIAAHTPELQAAMAVASQGAEAFFGAVENPISVDVGVLERSARVAVVAGDFGWDDVGTWAALRRVRVLDAAGNATHGDVYTVDSGANVVHADAGRVVLYGVKDLVVVSKPGLTMVTTVEHSDALKRMLDALPPDVVRDA
ncbi:MAG: mannose-1-phosphate guanylyltransferase [Gemmatimonadaceae bacterium]|nr:mannose-1-phosphate guanylyltransferase [Gemmatimonadaceae bacterium]